MFGAVQRYPAVFARVGGGCLAADVAIAAQTTDFRADQACFWVVALTHDVEDAELGTLVIDDATRAVLGEGDEARTR